MEIYLYKKSAPKINDKIYAFQNLHDDLTVKLIENILHNQRLLLSKDMRDYNPLVKDREVVDTIKTETLIENSPFFCNLYKYFAIDDNEKIDTTENFDDNSKYSLMIYKIDNDIFVKSFDGNKLLSEDSLIGEFTQTKLKKINNKIIIFEGSFDFYFSLENDVVIIKNSSKFEKICNYETYFDNVRNDKILKIQESGIIKNFDEIKDEIDNKKHNRLFTQLNTLNIKTITSHSDLISRLEDKGIFFKNKQFEIKTPEHSYILLFLISGLVSINNFNQVVLSKDQQLVIDRDIAKTKLPTL